MPEKQKEGMKIPVKLGGNFYGEVRPEDDFTQFHEIYTAERADEIRAERVNTVREAFSPLIPYAAEEMVDAIGAYSSAMLTGDTEINPMEILDACRGARQLLNDYDVMFPEHGERLAGLKKEIQGIELMVEGYKEDNGNPVSNTNIYDITKILGESPFEIANTGIGPN